MLNSMDRIPSDWKPLFDVARKAMRGNARSSSMNYFFLVTKIDSINSYDEWTLSLNSYANQIKHENCFECAQHKNVQTRTISKENMSIMLRSWLHNIIY